MILLALLVLIFWITGLTFFIVRHFLRTAAPRATHPVTIQRKDSYQLKNPLLPNGRPHRASSSTSTLTAAPADDKPLERLEVEPAKQERKPDDAEKKQRKVKQRFEAFLVIDIEGTCMQGTDFNYPNEIIEWPVLLMKWKDRDRKGRASQLEVIDEFRSFVRPTWRPKLSDFCVSLTGITQADVDSSPTFPEVMERFEAFLLKNELIEKGTGTRRCRFTWCSDGPFDIRDFVVKQCFISKMEMPQWIQGDVLDVRKPVMALTTVADPTEPTMSTLSPPSIHARRRSLNIPGQLNALSLGPFQGRQHSGIDDTRNIARIIQELARRNVRLEPNTPINPRRRWWWMGSPRTGEVHYD